MFRFLPLTIHCTRGGHLDSQLSCIWLQRRQRFVDASMGYGSCAAEKERIANGHR
jgi:hypothetical protein